MEGGPSNAGDRISLFDNQNGGLLPANWRIEQSQAAFILRDGNGTERCSVAHAGEVNTWFSIAFRIAATEVFLYISKVGEAFKAFGEDNDATFTAAVTAGWNLGLRGIRTGANPRVRQCGIVPMSDTGTDARLERLHDSVPIAI